MGMDAVLVVEIETSSGSHFIRAKETKLSLMPQIGTEFVGGPCDNNQPWPMLVGDVLWSDDPEWMIIKLIPTDEMMESIEYLATHQIVNAFEDYGWFVVSNVSAMINMMHEKC